MLFKRGVKPTISTKVGTEDEETAGTSTAAAEVESDTTTGLDEAQKPPPMMDVFSWQHLNYTIATAGGEHRQLLHDVTGYVVPGKLTALMGESGAGKVRILSSLLRQC